MPKSATTHAVGLAVGGQAVGHLDAEAVVAEEDVADAGDEDLHRSASASSSASSSSTSISSGWKYR